MKKTFTFIVFILLIFTGCSKKENVKLTTSGNNAFAVDMGTNWEVQALTEVHGFAQSKKNKKYEASIFYTVDVIDSAGNVQRSIFTKQVDKKDVDKLSGISLESQFNLNESFPPGNYKIVYNIRDRLSNKTMNDTMSLKLQR